jgi:tRNA threonylcarbamoyladenosine biosynthesis protein TsaE
MCALLSSIPIDSLEATNDFAKELAGYLSYGDIVILEGDLGAGKTHFVKACAAALDYEKEVTSPTYAIANFYKLKDGHIIHTDLYRIDDYFAFQNLGIMDYFDDSIVFIEWGNKLLEYFSDYLLISIEFAEKGKEGRVFKISSEGATWKKKGTEFLNNFQQKNNK